MKTYIELINNSKLINMVQENDNGTRKEKLITIEDFVSSVTSSLDGKKNSLKLSHLYLEN